MIKNKRLLFYCFIVSMILIALDQIIKTWALNVLQPLGTIKVIPGLVNLTYVENRGAAFGIFQGHTVLLSLISLFFIVLLIGSIVSGKIYERSLIWSVSLIITGGIGNLIDRIIRGFVVDYIDIDFGFLKSFPVFNLADCCVVVGAIILFIYTFISIIKDGKSRKISSTKEETL